MNNNKTQRGITLIALVITIIVMLILVAVTITIAINGGLFGMAKDAKADTEEELAKENALSTGRVKIDDTWYDSMEDYVNGNKSKNQSDDSAGGKTGSTAEKLSDTDTTETWTVESFGNLNDDLGLPKEKNIIAKKGTEEYEQQVIIPAGFIQATDSADTLEGGIVIEDASTDETKKGNQFVWVPVNQKLAFKEQEKESGTIKLGRYDFGEPTDRILEGPEIEKEDSEFKNELARDIEEFELKTNLAKGYYIGRYELGVGSVCKLDSQVKDLISPYVARTLTQEMYGEVKNGERIVYKSDMINSYSWDTAVLFIMKCSGDTDYPYITEIKNEVLSTTGILGDERCKINDMGGNAEEWSAEVRNTNSVYKHVTRGRSYSSLRTTDIRSTSARSGCGTRPILYITETRRVEFKNMWKNVKQKLTVFLCLS